MKNFRYYALFVLLAASGCAGKLTGTVTSQSKYPAAIERAKKNKRYMVLHSGVNLYSITSAEIDKARKQVTVQLDKVDSSYLIPKAMRQAPSQGKPPLAPETHLYMSDSTSYTLDEPHTIMLNKVARVEVMD